MSEAEIEALVIPLSISLQSKPDADGAMANARPVAPASGRKVLQRSDQSGRIESSGWKRRERLKRYAIILELIRGATTEHHHRSLQGFLGSRDFEWSRQDRPGESSLQVRILSRASNACLI
jgi:hypothetical protein